MVAKCWLDGNTELTGLCDCTEQCDRKSAMVDMLLRILDEHGVEVAAGIATVMRAEYPGFSRN
jgi:hypothetical protein